MGNLAEIVENKSENKLDDLQSSAHDKKTVFETELNNEEINAKWRNRKTKNFVKCEFSHVGEYINENDPDGFMKDIEKYEKIKEDEMKEIRDRFTAIKDVDEITKKVRDEINYEVKKIRDKGKFEKMKEVDFESDDFYKDIAIMMNNCQKKSLMFRKQINEQTIK